MFNQTWDDDPKWLICFRVETCWNHQVAGHFSSIAEWMRVPSKWNDTVDLHEIYVLWALLVTLSQNEKRHGFHRQRERERERMKCVRVTVHVGTSGDYSRNFDASTSWWCWKKELPFATGCFKVLQIYDTEGNQQHVTDVPMYTSSAKVAMSRRKAVTPESTGNRRIWSNNTHTHNTIYK